MRRCLEAHASLGTATNASDVTLMPALKLSGFQSVDGLAFDAAGNLDIAAAAVEQVFRVTPRRSLAARPCLRCA